ncbi:MAG TPA: hypothetical protein VEL11_13805 [Candidatus Bathyarchaeia archaeon]|nr:hypothetical protein [Candidatus Bathyarchaeia archaeon]
MVGFTRQTEQSGVVNITVSGELPMVRCGWKTTKTKLVEESNKRPTSNSRNCDHIQTDATDSNQLTDSS